MADEYNSSKRTSAGCIQCGGVIIASKAHYCQLDEYAVCCSKKCATEFDNLLAEVSKKEPTEIEVLRSEIADLKIMIAKLTTLLHEVVANGRHR